MQNQDQQNVSPGYHSTEGVAVLGSTGSIGRSTLDVINSSAGHGLKARGLSANGSWQSLAQQAIANQVSRVAVMDTAVLPALRDALAGKGIEVLGGQDGLIRIVQADDTQRVITGIVGRAGLESTLAAIDARKLIGLANKETLVVAGEIVMQRAREQGVTIIPVDSEHSAVFQAMTAGRRSEVKRIILTSSGGPFRGWSRDRLGNVTPEQALNHPTWKMGPKITVDSATLMNKALEVIEARWLFDLEPDQIQVVVHPESVVHSMVEFVDGSVIAQLSPPDMKLPIQMALTWPERRDGPSPRMDWSQSFSLNFQPPDLDNFPCLGIGYEVIRRGGTAPAVVNAANEEAVGRFLSGSLRFLEIPQVCRAVLEHHDFDARPTLDRLLAVDTWARQEVARWNS
ncbi:MAG: 1-deoxy-D-xylulose-5-phosphate reductoisomerase [Planctomycetota bacterium]|nr:MAG: 1-deoxy-D-xylulose-5-phosphate reductoisomerase [Planctomycetota bacterium]